MLVIGSSEQGRRESQEGIARPPKTKLAEVGTSDSRLGEDRARTTHHRTNLDVHPHSSKARPSRNGFSRPLTTSIIPNDCLSASFPTVVVTPSPTLLHPACCASWERACLVLSIERSPLLSESISEKHVRHQLRGSLHSVLFQIPHNRS